MKRSLRWLLAATLVAVGILGSRTQADEGLRAGVDLLFLSPKLSSTGIGNVFYGQGVGAIDAASGSISGSELDFAQRLIIGYEGDQGGGVQVRWFTFDNQVGYNGEVDHETDGLVSLTGFLNLDVDALDAEFTQRGEFNVWDWVATAGARYARVSIREDISDPGMDIDWESFSDTVWFGSTGVQFEGAGPTVSVEGSRPIFTDEISFFGRARTSLLYGEVEQFSAWRAGGGIIIPDEFVQVWEVQAGLQMEREYDSFDWLLGIFWEAQRWDSQLLGDLAFHGFGINTGIEY
ncbi:MAG: hypothetical protein KDA57_11725 [Planctomycetales bacterium]|nr:hypothetical protein [Planctomycetales bacterium]